MSRALVAPVALYLVALVIRLWAAGRATFPPTEVSAYYVGVARNLVEGRGLVSDALWSYATPPLVLPRPAFELWLPTASLVPAPAMALLGPGLAPAQLAMALLGAVLAPLAWLVARDAAARLGLGARRTATVAIGSGLLVAVLGPLVLAAMAPDSTLPFAVFGTLACWLMPGALHDRRRAALLGLVLAAAYLSRQEAIYLGLVHLALAVGHVRDVPRRERLRALVARLGPTVIVGGLAVAPWLARQWLAFGSPFPGPTAENLFFVRNTDVFAYLERPTLERFLAQGPAGILANIAAALLHNLLAGVVLPAMPVGLIGLLGLPLLWRRRAAAERADPATTASPLRALLLGGLVTYLATSLLFPVASLWGTFIHAAGPLLVGLTVAAALGLDQAVAWLRARRAWPRENAWLAPVAALALAAPMCALQVGLFAQGAREEEARYVALAPAVAALLGPPPVGGPAARADALSDHPIWLAETLRRPMGALPDEPAPFVWRLSRDLQVKLVVIVGRPKAVADLAASPCFEPAALAVPGVSAFRPRAACD